MSHLNDDLKFINKFVCGFYTRIRYFKTSSAHFFWEKDSQLAGNIFSFFEQQ